MKHNDEMTTHPFLVLLSIDFNLKIIFEDNLYFKKDECKTYSGEIQYNSPGMNLKNAESAGADVSFLEEQDVFRACNESPFTNVYIFFETYVKHIRNFRGISEDIF